MALVQRTLRRVGASAARQGQHRVRVASLSSFSTPWGSLSSEDSDQVSVASPGSITSCVNIVENRHMPLSYPYQSRQGHQTSSTAMPILSANCTFGSGSNSFANSMASGPQQTCHHQIRPISSISDLIPAVPEFAQHWTIWGGSGILLKALHHDGLLPYWACMAITNVIVRSSLVPLVIQSAHTSTRFAKVAPEVQFLVTIFQNDSKKLKERNASPVEQYALMRATMQTLGGIYKLHKIHPLAVFKAPLMQLPIFWYFSIDIRKIINGADPELAQQLTESGFLWITDLTEPDPWYGLPIISGLLLYMNVEVALGKQSLSGEATSKANVAKVMKDFFQSLAVFMPCFMTHSPAGVQIYLATSFIFTMFQGAALRNDSCRGLVGLAAKSAPPPEAIIAKEFMDLKQKEHDAKEARGDGEILGTGVLAEGWESSIPGSARPSTIVGSAGSGTVLSGAGDSMSAHAGSDPTRLRELWSPTLRVATEPQQPQLVRDEKQDENEIGTDTVEQEREYMPQISEAIMEAANRGEAPPKPVIMAPKEDKKKESSALNIKGLTEKRKKVKSTSRKSKRSRNSKPRRR